MSSSAINGPRGGVDMRDVRAIHERLDALEVTLGERAANEALMRQETRAWMQRSENRTLELVQRLGVAVPSERPEPAPAHGVSARVRVARERLGAWMLRAPTNRALLYGLAVAGVGATLSACAAAPLAQLILGGHP